MSQRELRGSSSRLSNTSLQSSIQYRQVVHRRAGRDDPQEISARIKTPKPSHSLKRTGNQLHNSSLRTPLCSSIQQLAAKPPISTTVQHSGRFSKPMSRLSITVNHQSQRSRPQNQPKKRGRISTVGSYLSPSNHQSHSVRIQPAISSNPETRILQRQLTILEKRLDALIQAKLTLTFESTKNSKLIKKQLLQSQRNSLDRQLQQVVKEIKAFGQRTGEEGASVFSKKIDFLQKLMAEQSAEAEIIKKHYYEGVSNQAVKKSGMLNSSVAQISRRSQAIQRERNKTINSPDEPKLKPLFRQSLNKQSYRSPKQQDYESYRYKHKAIAPNLQPIPRSSYKRDYLQLKTQPQKKIINKDNSPYHPHHKRPIGSSYLQQFRRQKTEVTNHKELDAYRNKIKTIKVSYMPQFRRQESISYNSEDYQQEKGSRILKSSNTKEVGQSRISQQESVVNRRILQSEASRSFKGDRSEERSKAKDSQLRQYHYQLRKMFRI